MQYEFIKSSIFTKMVHDYLSDEDYAAFQQFLLAHPDSGDLCQKCACQHSWRKGIILAGV